MRIVSWAVGVATGLILPPLIRLIRRKIRQSVASKASTNEMCAFNSNGTQQQPNHFLDSKAFERDCETNDQWREIEINAALFFPDETKSPRSIMAQHFSKLPINGKTVHEHSPFDELFNVLKSVKRSLDVCMYIITYPMFAEFLIDAFQKRKVAVRIVIDSREDEAFSSQLARIKEAGIEVRNNPPSNICLMHNKFVIIDNRILITGSLNWTRAAISENYDNAIITTLPQFVSPYSAEFEKLWQAFAPTANKCGLTKQERCKNGAI